MSSIAIGCDDAAVEFKEMIKEYLALKGYQYEDFGVQKDEHTDYPDIALAVANGIASGKYERGILICGTGIGMCIVANKVGGVRAALCHDVYSAERARKSNNAQIITIGARVIGSELAKKIVDAWLQSEFEGGRSAQKVEKIYRIDNEYRKIING